MDPHSSRNPPRNPPLNIPQPVDAEPGLAIGHPVADAWAERGSRLLKAFARHHGLVAAVSDPAHPAPVDGVLLWMGGDSCQLVGAAEARCRRDTLADLQRWGGTVVVTYSKLVTLTRAARLHRVPAYFVAEFGCGGRWYCMVADETGMTAVPFAVRHSETRARSVSTDTIVRPNAYIPLAHGALW